MKLETAKNNNSEILPLFDAKHLSLFCYKNCFNEISEDKIIEYFEWKCQTQK